MAAPREEALPDVLITNLKYRLYLDRLLGRHFDDQIISIVAVTVVRGVVEVQRTNGSRGCGTGYRVIIFYIKARTLPGNFGRLRSDSNSPVY